MVVIKLITSSFFDLEDIICYIGVTQSLFLAFALQILINKNRSANRVLSALLITTVIMLLTRTSHLRSMGRILYTANTVMFLFGPLIYLYIRQLTFEEQTKKKFSFYHYIPAIVYLALVIYNLFLEVKEINHNIKTYYPSLEMLAVILNFYYLFKSHKLIKLYQKNEKNNISYNQNVTSFLHSFTIGLFIAFLLWFICLLNVAFIKLNLPFIHYQIVWAAIITLVYIIGYYSLKQPEIFKIKLKTDKEKIEKNRMNNNHIIQLQKELKLLMDKEKIYLDNQLTLLNLAEKLNTSSNNISWLLNSVYNSTFYEYINRYRIKDFISKVKNGEHKKHTVLSLSIDSGFNSKSTFNRVFKAEMNDTPTNYIKSLHLS